MEKEKVVVITGGSSGIGRAVSHQFLQKGWAVYDLSRNGESREGITHIKVDVTDPLSLTQAFEQIYLEKKRLDLVITNAGFGISGATEFTDIKEAKSLFDVNFFGTASTISAAMKYLRESRGRVITVSSVAGALPVPFQSYYSASKAAVNALTECMRNEARLFGISFCSVLPGDVQTGFTAARRKEIVGDDLYQGKIARSVSAMEKDEQTGMTADYVAKRIYVVAVKNRVRPFYTIGNQYKILSFIARFLPRRWVSWIMGKIYAA